VKSKKTKPRAKPASKPKRKSNVVRLTAPLRRKLIARRQNNDSAIGEALEEFGGELQELYSCCHFAIVKASCPHGDTMIDLVMVDRGLTLSLTLDEARHLRKVITVLDDIESTTTKPPKKGA